MQTETDDRPDDQGLDNIVELQQNQPEQREVEHKCAVSFLRLFKPHDYFLEKYGDMYFGLNLVRMLLLKQRNRGQDAAGIASLYFPDQRQGQEHLYVKKHIGTNPTDGLYKKIMALDEARNTRLADNFRGDVFLGHLLYSTVLEILDKRFVHPVIKQSSVPALRIALAMNGNFANNHEQRDTRAEWGHHIASNSDMENLVEMLGHYLHDQWRSMLGNGTSVEDMNRDLDLRNMMSDLNSSLRGAFTLAGLLGNGDSFFVRDPKGIRPIHYFWNDELMVAASEPAAIESTLRNFGVRMENIRELSPGQMCIIKRDGRTSFPLYVDPREIEHRPCMFEDIYFSRPNNPGVQTKRRRLGELLADRVVEEVGLDKVVVSYVPNTSETAAIGLFREIDRIHHARVAERVFQMSKEGPVPAEKIGIMLDEGPIYSQLITKDAKLRGFITHEKERGSFIAGAYDALHDSSQRFSEYRLVIVEDSIVKGSTLQKNVIKTLMQAGYQDITIVSSCPQIRYPCCYGIEMSKLKEFIAFRAVVSLIGDQGLEPRLEEIRGASEKQQEKVDDDSDYIPERNLLSEIYSMFTDDEISGKIAELLRPEDMPHWNGKIRVIYPGVRTLRRGLDDLYGQMDAACVDGQYPEIGGKRMLNRALMNYFKGQDGKSY